MLLQASKLAEMLPPSYHRLHDGQRLTWGGREWLVMVGRGHSPEHAMFYCPELSVLVSGDQLLPKISTNISVTAVDPEAEPMSAWLGSLAEMACLPADTLVLPSHGPPFRGLRPRVRDLQRHHAAVLDKVLVACADRALSGFEVSETLFPRRLSDFDHILALGESLAHIRYLVVTGRMERRRDAGGVVRYRSLPG